MKTFKNHLKEALLLPTGSTSWWITTNPDFSNLKVISEHSITAKKFLETKYIKFSSNTSPLLIFWEMYKLGFVRYTHRSYSYGGLEYYKEFLFQGFKKSFIKLIPSIIRTVNTYRDYEVDIFIDLQIELAKPSNSIKISKLPGLSLNIEELHKKLL